jgi:tetratricopeptide (TPR) repeat protein
METLEAALTQHPALLELPTLERLAASIVQSASAQPEAARHVLARLVILLEGYNQAHAEQVNLEEQTRFVAVHDSLLIVAEALDADLMVGLRHSLGWALNTLGNTHAGQNEHAAAIDAYTRAIAHAPQDAMLYRNRAGEHIEMAQWAQAEADVERAAALEPDAPRLAALRETLAEQSGE